MLKRLVDSLARRRSGIAVLQGVASMLDGVERLIAPRPKAAVPIPSTPKTPGPTPKKPREHYFTVRRTRSEIGYTYWVLQGFGCYRSFTLFDTWHEAVAEAGRRVAERTTEQQLEPTLA